MDFVAAKAKVCCGGNRVVISNAFTRPIVGAHNLFPLLRCVVFNRKASKS
jgi:hypothetical protein